MDAGQLVLLVAVGIGFVATFRKPKTKAPDGAAPDGSEAFEDDLEADDERPVARREPSPPGIIRSVLGIARDRARTSAIQARARAAEKRRAATEAAELSGQPTRRPPDPPDPVAFEPVEAVRASANDEGDDVEAPEVVDPAIYAEALAMVREQARSRPATWAAELTAFLETGEATPAWKLALHDAGAQVMAELLEAAAVKQAADSEARPAAKETPNEPAAPEHAARPVASEQVLPGEDLVHRILGEETAAPGAIDAYLNALDRNINDPTLPVLGAIYESRDRRVRPRVVARLTEEKARLASQAEARTDQQNREAAEAEQKKREQAAAPSGGTGAFTGTLDATQAFMFAETLASADLANLPLQIQFQVMTALAQVSEGITDLLQQFANGLDNAMIDGRVVEHFSSSIPIQASVTSRLADGAALALALYEDYFELVRRGQVPDRQVLVATANG